MFASFLIHIYQSLWFLWSSSFIYHHLKHASFPHMHTSATLLIDLHHVGLSFRPMILFVSKAKLWTHFVVSLVQLYWYCNGRFINKSNRFAVNQSHSQASDYSMSALSCFLPRQCCRNDSCCMQHDWLECWLQAWQLQMVRCCRCFRTLYFAFL